MQLLKGFKQFVLKGNVIDLAVAVIVGSAFNSVVQSFVKDLLTPLIAAVGGQARFSDLEFTINHSRFLYGDFLNVLISFIMNAAIVYFLVVLPVTKFVSLARLQTPADPTTKKCQFCQSEINIKAIKCPFCTSVLSKTSPDKKS